MPTARTKANRKYNEKAYDRLAITIPKGKKSIVEEYAKANGESVNGLVNSLLRAAVGLSEEEWKNDFASLINIALNVYDICEFNFDLSKINFDEVGGKLGTETINLLLNLNLLGNDQTKNDLVVAALVTVITT